MEDVVSIYPISTIQTEYIPCFEEEDDYNNEIINGDMISNEELELKTFDISLKNFSLALDRSDTSNRFGSLLATTLIQDIRISVAARANKTNSEIDKKL